MILYCQWHFIFQIWLNLTRFWCIFKGFRSNHRFFPNNCEHTVKLSSYSDSSLCDPRPLIEVISKLGGPCATPLVCLSEDCLLLISVGMCLIEYSSLYWGTLLQLQLCAPANITIYSVTFFFKSSYNIQFIPAVSLIKYFTKFVVKTEEI